MTTAMTKRPGIGAPFRRLTPLILTAGLVGFLVVSGPAAEQRPLGRARPDVTPAAQPDDLGDAAWLELLRAMQAPPPPPEWDRKAPTAAERAAFDRVNGGLAVKAADKAKAFYTQFPQHPHALEARRLELQLLAVAIRFGETNSEARLVILEDERLKDPRLTDNERFELRVRRAMLPAAKLQSADPAAALTALEKGVRDLQREFPQRSETWELLMTVAEAYLEHGQPAAARQLAGEVSRAARGDLELAARKFAARVDRLGQSLALKFTAVDGRAVDLEKLRGKVVLIDFWATWCAPCRAAMPDVLAAYEKFHPQGFEIIGISFDQDQSLLTQYVAKMKLPWPQYFDGLLWQNRLGREFDVTLPTMWLVDKQGKLRELDARRDLEGKIARLLREN